MLSYCVKHAFLSAPHLGKYSFQMSDLARKIKDARLEAGLSQAQVGKACGVTRMAVSQWEKEKDGTIPTGPNLLAFARAVGKDPSWFEPGLQSPQFERVEAEYIRLPLVGFVQAGAWRTNDDWEWEDAVYHHVPKPDGHDTYFLLEVRGDSMNVEYPEGSFLVCVPMAQYNHVLESDDHVVVQRHENGSYEYTVKVLIQDDDGVLWLEPRSTNRAHQAIPFPKDEAIDDGGVPPIMISAIVVADYRKRVKRKR